MIKKILTVFVIVIMAFCVLNNSVLAACGNPQKINDDCNDNGILDRCEDPNHKYFAGVCNPLDDSQTGTNVDQLGGSVPSGIKNKVLEVWATARVLVQIASVACVVIAGLRYMWVGPDKKADIKKGITNIVIGAVLIFCTVTIIDFVVSFFNTSVF